MIVWLWKRRTYMCIGPSEHRPHIASQMNWLGVFVKPSVVISVCVRAGGGREVRERAGIRAAVLRLSALRWERFRNLQ